MKIVIWLDDLRDPYSKEWNGLIKTRYGNDICIVWVKTYNDFISAFDEAILLRQLWGISFDNDLGEEKEGYHAFNYVEEVIRGLGYFCLPEMYVHSSNPAAVKKIESGIDNLEEWLYSTYGHPSE